MRQVCIFGCVPWCNMLDQLLRCASPAAAAAAAAAATAATCASPAAAAISVSALEVVW